ncbi:helix-turn-helix domain-containing protein [Micromonospora echinospora]|jgi:transcriptional regulator with XRE-family HTH domain|uniref:helix-turn-helix domain-containing protein n=1 Tax=Micromonospora echinospora TaxID=1877 RepID=UPI0037937E9E
MATPKDLPRDVGGFIRDLRRNAKISLRQLAEQAGVSNPYLSQIERGLRKPSAEVLQQLASALRVSTPAMYLRAGLLDDREGQGVLAAIAVDPDLTMAQKQSLTQIYETFRRENVRLAEATAAAEQNAPGSTTGQNAPGSTTATGRNATEAAPTATADPALATAEASLVGPAADAAATVNPAATGPTTEGGTPTEAVLESVAVTEAGPAPAPGTRPTGRTRVRTTPRNTPKKATAPAVEEENPS